MTTDDGNIFVLFSNGSIQSLQQCLQDSKSESRGEAAADHTNLYVKNFSERSHLVQRLQTHVFHHNGRLYSSHIYSVVHPRTKVGGKNGDSTDWWELEHAFFRSTSWPSEFAETSVFPWALRDFSKNYLNWAAFTYERFTVLDIPAVFSAKNQFCLNLEFFFTWFSSFVWKCRKKSL